MTRSAASRQCGGHRRGVALVLVLAAVALALILGLAFVAAQGLAKYDKMVATAKENGVELVLLLHGNVPGNGWDNRLESYDRFARFAAFMAKRYPAQPPNW